MTTSSSTFISTGYNHSCGIFTTSNTLQCWGDNVLGQLGLGDTTDRSTPTTVNLGTGRSALAVSAGYQHTCAILDNGKIKCWGRGDGGQLGNGATGNQNSPVAVTMGDGVTAKKISLGDYHTCAIFNDDKVYCWGENDTGWLGIGTVSDRDTPAVVDLGADRTATAISTGSGHSCALLDDSSVKCWGSDAYGQRGNRNDESSRLPLSVPLGSGRSATAIHAKGFHSCAILDDGSVLCWGENIYGKLGDGTTTSRKTPVAADLGEGRTATLIGGGRDHTCVVLDDGTLKCWGNNNFGQLNLPTTHRGDQSGEMGRT